MLAFLRGPVIGVIAFFLYSLAIAVLGSILLIGILIHFITPIPSWRRKIYQSMFHMPSLWGKTLRFTVRLATHTEWEVSGLENLKQNKSYLLIANHQGFLDIVVLQSLLSPYVPELRYFMKRALLWVPILGQACYALGYPFMKRHTKEYLRKHPEAANSDLETTRKTCQRFATTPITLINYVEGTRFTENKHRKQQAPYQHLLKPKAGGISFILSAMEQQIDTLLNVTIVYSGEPKTTWGFLQGKLNKIYVNIEQIPITPDLRGDYQNDAVFREHFQNRLNTIWAEKDEKIRQYYAKEIVRLAE